VTAPLLIAAVLALRASGATAEPVGGAREPRDSTHTWPRVEYSDVRSAAHDSTPSDTSIDAPAAGDSAVSRGPFSSVERWRAVLDRPERAALEMPDQIVDSLQLSKGALPAPRVVAEMGAAGYRLNRELTFLPKQYFLIFGRAEEPGPR